jgi:MFS family permease
MVRLTAENRRWWILGLTVFGAIYVQELLGFGPIAAGLSLLPVMVPLLLLAPVAGRLYDRIGPRGLVAAGAVLLCAGLLWPAALRGQAQGVVQTLRQGGGTVGLAVMGTAVAGIQRSQGSLIPGISAALYLGGGVVLAGAVVAWALLRHLPAADAPATRSPVPRPDARAGAPVHNTPNRATVS